MNPLAELFSLDQRFVPAACARLVRRAFLWKNRARFRPYIVTRSVQGEAVQAYIGDATGAQWYGRTEVTSPELPFIRDNMISPGDLVFDVGSHHGFYAVYMARRAARLVAIEPNPFNVELVHKNIDLNRLQNVIVRQCAVGESTGKISLLEDSVQGGVQSADTKTRPAVDVDLLTLDSLAHEYGFPQFVKIDVEGFEASVLRGSSEIMRRRPKIAIEVHVEWVMRYGSSVREVLDLLHLESYRVFILPHRAISVIPWSGEELSTELPKFHLFLRPR